MTPKSAAPSERARTALTTIDTGVVTNWENTSASMLRATRPLARRGALASAGAACGGSAPGGPALEIAAGTVISDPEYHDPAGRSMQAAWRAGSSDLPGAR